MRKKRGAEHWSKELVPTPAGDEGRPVIEHVRNVLREKNIVVDDWTLAQEIELRKIRQQFRGARRDL